MTSKSSNSKFQNRNKKSSYSKSNNYKDSSLHRSANYNKRDYSSSKQNYQNRKSHYKDPERIKETETIADIRSDIERIEKEIRLEIKEIKSLKLGV
ncbi:MAG TPA: hypothetical protein DCE02_03925 [Ruminiclostridium sp.]|jgi:hypothetical protein|uniref:Uncharacterized protein n=1 Tax=Acetivibrio saccincola TaxID=1677857 RepID=A0A2K9ELC5_9FIRM|nr:hypothetical protein [Acetivibrio saccincola]HAA43137.1 hypothetical protein [Ruminiclostridium sp.]AUG58833.1 hypothetical protein HVS_14910 [Acetivibrio saccincola]NLW26272.1 hypothetical protein [Acetivibrio saccincola]HOA97031.1 hypothetical protein [Acetivibrio saccincola]HQD29031.1 hypothetical protein [Acetivibrio saccincola]